MGGMIQYELICHFSAAKSCHVTPQTAAHQASLSFTISQSLLRFMSIQQVMLYNHLILCCPLFLFPVSFYSVITGFEIYTIPLIMERIRYWFSFLKKLEQFNCESENCLLQWRQRTQIRMNSSVIMVLQICFICRCIYLENWDICQNDLFQLELEICELL